MSAEQRDLTESRRAVLRAALELGEGIAALRRSLDRARGIDPNSPDFRDLQSRHETEPGLGIHPTTDPL